MALSNIARAGMELGDAAIGADKGVNVSQQLNDAARQLAVGSSAIKTIGAQLRKMAQRGTVPATEIGGIRSQIQSLGDDINHAVSAGWWIGLARGTCRHKLAEVTGTDLAGYVDHAKAHGLALVNLSKTNWNAGTAESRFNAIRTTMQKMTLSAMPSGMTMATTFLSQFAASLK